MDENVRPEKITSVGIEVGQNIYARMKDMNNTHAHVFAEFVDNAFQSYLDHKDELRAFDPHYKLRVSIDFQWSSDPDENSVSITDNAWGIDHANFLKAFTLAHTPENNEGLNEYGMGMKTAALWLGKRWELRSSALHETIERKVVFLVEEVVDHNSKELPVEESAADGLTHFTEIHVKNYTDNAPSAKNIEQLKRNLASIYRQMLRNGEIELVVNNERLSFEEIPVLVAPWYKEDTGPDIIWKKEVQLSLMGNYKARGFVAILKDMKSANNGLVILRRGRVILGAEEGKRYFPKCIFGSVGNFRYKRLFGELELEGFKSSFNKNGVIETQNLEAMMMVLRGEIHKKEFDLLAQADHYRLDILTKKVKQTKKAHENASRKEDRTIAINTQLTQKLAAEIQQQIDNNSIQQTVEEAHVTNEPHVIDTWDETFMVDHIPYTMKMVFVSGGSDLIWIDVSQKDNHIVECKLNTSHPFCETYFTTRSFDPSCMAVFRAMAMAKFTSQNSANPLAQMFVNFNEFIRQIKT